MKYTGIAWFTLLVIAASSPLRADTFYPMLMSIHPTAIQVGQTTECQIRARYNLYGAYKVFVTGDGVTAEVDPPAKPTAPNMPKPNVNPLKVRFKVAADALLGVRDVRVITPQGASTVGQIVVVRDPIVKEAANNDTMKTAQAVSLPATVCGAIEKAEDVDYYKFTAAANMALTFHVQAQRLENRIHDLQDHADPILTLKNAAGVILATNDNYFFGDPLLHFRFAVAGEYYLEIRDVRYGGNPEWTYCIEMHDRPFVTNVFPSCITPGKPTTLKLIGYNLPTNATATLTMPANAPEGLRWEMLTVNNQTSNAMPLLVSRLPEIMEASGDHATADKAQPITVPAGICGRIDKGGEVDCYVFEAKAGEKFSFQVQARNCQSMLDSNLRVLNAKGERLLENDDNYARFVYADSRLENWAAPAAGKYIVEVRDLHLRGGPEFAYCLQVTRSQPHFSLELDTDKTPLAPGITGVVFVRVIRHNGFAGDVQLAIDGLPPGVTARCGKILATGKDGCILLQAAANAPLGAANIRITGMATHTENGKTEVLSAVAKPLQEIYMPGGGRYHFPVETHTVSVGDLLDIRSVKISPTAVTLKPGESKKIEIVLERAPGFKGTVSLDAVYQHLSAIYGDSLPPGVTVDDKASVTLLTGDQTKGAITLKAAPGAKPVENQQVALMAHVSINFVMKFTYCGEPLRVTVLP